ncbi:MAG: hypothetical protein AAGN35_19820, partial [Bacteroidota bacterium]
MQFFNRIRSLLLLAFLLPALGALAQPDFTGSDVLVNTTTTNSQQNPASAMDSLGNYVIAWESFGEDGDGWGIYFQLYDSSGATVGSATKVNSTTDGDQRFPDVAMRADGEFCVCWQSAGQDGDGWGAYRRCYDASGSAQTSESRLNSTTSGHQLRPKVAMNADGFIAWTWQAENEDSDGFAVMTRVTNSSYANLNSEVLVNTTEAGFQGYPDVAVADDGSYVVVWQSYNQDASGTNGVYGQAFDVSYTATGNEFLVNTTTARNQQEPAIGMDSAGNYIVAWADFDGTNSVYNIYAQRYTTGSVASGSDFQVNSSSASGCDHPRVAVTKEGSEFIVWENYGGDGSFTGVYGQIYTANKTAFGGEFVINARTTDFQQACDPAAYADSLKWAVGWQDGLRNSSSTNDGDDYGIYTKQSLVQDTTDPTAVCQNITVYLDGSGSATITASDVDGGSSDNSGLFSLSVNTTDFGCSDLGFNVVLLTVTDSASNTASCNAAVNVVDSTSPTAVCSNITVYLDGSGNASITAADVDGGSSDNCSISSTSLSQTNFTCSDVGTVTPTLTVTDPSSNSATCTANLTVVDSTSPTAVCQNLNVYLDGSGSATITGADLDGGSTDNCSSVSTFTASQTSFSCNDVGANSVTLTITDAGSNSATCSSTVTVIDSVTPTAVCQNLNVYLDGNGNATISAADVDGGSSDNCSISSTAIDVSSFTCSNIGSNTVTLTVTDGSSNSAACTSTVTVIDSVSPTAVCNNLTVYLDGSGSGSITAADVDGGSTDNCAVSSTSLDVSDFTCTNIGSNTVTLTAMDASSNSGTCTSSVTVLDSVTPTAVCQSISVYLDGSGSATLTGSDIDGGSSDNCTVSSLTASTTSFACVNIGANSVTLTVTDQSSNSATCTATVTVIDSVLPTAVCNNLTVYLDGSGSATITASDVDGGSTDNCSVSSTAIDVSSFTCTNTGSNTVTLTVTDASSNTATCTGTVTVIDSTAPTAVCNNLTVYLDGSGSATITASDVDGGSTDNCSVSSTAIDVSSFTCTNTGSNTVTLTVTD